MSTKPLIVERTYDAPAARVWQALTNRDELQQWYFNLEAFRAEVGFEFSFYGGPDGRSYKHLCRITEVIPGRKLTYTWQYEGHAGESEVSFELFPEGERTRVVLTHTGLDTFPADNKDFDASNFEAGWNAILGKNLQAYLAGKP